MGQMIPDLPLPAPVGLRMMNGGGFPKKPQQSHDADAAFTESVIAATGPNAHPRLAEIMPSLVRHLHAFAREVNLTVAEWSAAVDLVRPPPLLFHQFPTGAPQRVCH